MPASHVVLVDVVDVCGPDGYAHSDADINVVVVVDVVLVDDCGPDGYAHSDADAYPVQCGLLVNNGGSLATSATTCSRLRYIQYKFTSCPHYHHHQRQLEDF